MATHSSILAWKIPRSEEPGGVQTMGLQRDMTERQSAAQWMLSFRSAFSLSSFTLIKRLFRSSSLYAIRISSAYPRLLIFLLILVYDSSSPVFCMMYSEYKLNKQGNNIQPCCFQSLSYVQLFTTHGLQKTRLPCPAPFPKVCSNSFPLSQWWHQILTSSITLFSCHQSFPALEYFPMSQLFALGDQSIGA